MFQEESVGESLLDTLDSSLRLFREINRLKELFFLVGNLESIVLSCFKYSLWKIGIDRFNLFQEFSLEIWNREIQLVLKNSLWKFGIERFNLF